MAHAPHDHGPLVIHTRENRPTALHRAQELCQEFQPMHDRMVDSFRRSGWGREDAVHEADAHGFRDPWWECFTAIDTARARLRPGYATPEATQEGVQQ